MNTDAAPWGYDSYTHTEVIPKPPPRPLRWTVGPVRPKLSFPLPGPHRPPPTESEFTVQLTADQQVDLSVSGEDAYNNPVDISGADAQWVSSDESIIAVTVDDADKTRCTAVAVGPIGTASVTVSNPAATVQGSIAIDVVAGNVAEIVVTPGTPTDKT